eukprot:3024545-Pyramimonas_sp.AAC.1
MFALQDEIYGSPVASGHLHRLPADSLQQGTNPLARVGTTIQTKQKWPTRLPQGRATGKRVVYTGP